MLKEIARVITPNAMGLLGLGNFMLVLILPGGPSHYLMNALILFAVAFLTLFLVANRLWFFGFRNK